MTNKSSQDLKLLLDVLPAVVRERLLNSNGVESLLEVVLDYGRPAEARFMDRVERMPEIIISEHDIEYVTKSIGEFGSDNRAGIERTLHRVSAIRNRHGKVIGLTCRVGRALEGTIDLIDAIVRSGQSILLLGRPGVGKTTKLREIARVLADEVGKRVVIVDTSNEIAGDGDVPHPGIGSARRMQVRVASEQHQVMIEAVENHMPEVIVIDEIGTEAEAAASRTIAERGVQLIGTAHGQTLENLMLNPTLCDLVGGIQAVTLSDAEAARRGTQKTVLERKAPPTFDVVIELLDYERLAVHKDVQRTVDLILRGMPPRPEVRVRTSEGIEIVQSQDPLTFEEGLESGAFFTEVEEIEKKDDLRSARQMASLKKKVQSSPSPAGRLRNESQLSSPPGLLRVFPYGINRTRLEKAIRDRRLPATVAADINQSDAVIVFRTTFQQNPRKVRELAGRPLPTAVVKSNTYGQISEALDELLQKASTGDQLGNEPALDEVAEAVKVALQTGKPVELLPQPGPVRKRQHQAAEALRVATEAVGQDPNRRLRILPIQLPA